MRFLTFLIILIVSNLNISRLDGLFLLKSLLLDYANQYYTRELHNKYQSSYTAPYNHYNGKYRKNIRVKSVSLFLMIKTE